MAGPQWLRRCHGVLTATVLQAQRHHRRVVSVIVTVLVVAGSGMLAAGLLAQRSAPQPAPSIETSSGATIATTATPGTPPTGAPSSPAPTGPVLSRSVPVTLTVPAIGVHSSLLTLGLNPDGTMEVPPLGPDSQAGWYRSSPTPGEVGPSVLLGHIDSARYGPGVFFELGALKRGDTVEVTRADRTVAVFRVDQVASYPKADFPSLQIYGNTRNAQLRLITCGGTFDPAARSYENNIVAYASLVGSRPQG